MKIAIIGLGYVGLPLSLQFARSDVDVLGLDIDPAKVESLNHGRSYIKHIGSPAIAELVKARRFAASTDFSRVRETEAVIICVPTPLKKNREPDISYILETGRAIAPHLQRGVLVVLESTTYPGTTDEELRPVLEAGSKLKAGKDFHLAFSPECESPSYVLMDILKSRGAEVEYYDPYVPVIRPTREHAHWTGTRSMAWNRKTVQSFDAVVIATNHQSVSYQELAEWSPCIMDTCNAMVGVATKAGQVWKT